MTGYVAFIDVLGFAALMDANFPMRFEAYSKCIGRTVESQQGLEYVVFSDSIVINTQEDTPDSLQVITRSCSRLYFELLNERFPFRGCISHGDYARLTHEHVKGTVLAGRPLVDAYHYEQVQEWIGIMLSPAVVRQLGSHADLRPYAVRYPRIPFKQGTDGQSADYAGFAVVPAETANPNLDDLKHAVDKCRKSVDELVLQAPDPRSQAKYRATRDFLDELDRKARDIVPRQP